MSSGLWHVSHELHNPIGLRLFLEEIIPWGKDVDRCRRLACAAVPLPMSDVDESGAYSR